MLKTKIFTKPSIKYLLIMLSCLCLSACGFHIRSKADIPPQMRVLYISSVDRHSVLAPLLRQNLQELGVNVVGSPQQAPLTLTILGEQFSQTKTMLGTAQTLNSVTLYYTVTFAIEDNTHKTLLSPITLTTTTSYLQNSSQILGDTTMLPSYQQELIRNMVSQILSHLSAKNTAHALSD